MPLFVVPLAPAEVGALTLWEWDQLCGRELVLFDIADHPLRGRLAARGVPIATAEAPLNARAATWAAVCEPTSPRLVELARAGADVSRPASDVPDSLTAAYGAPVARRAGAAVAALAAVMARLRGADGCPWDREQTHESLEMHLLEETYEVLDAIADRDPAGLQEELGDLLLQVVFHAQLASDERSFDLPAVVRGLVVKLVRRHPHVFGEIAVADASEVVRNWETIKRGEKERAGAFEGIPRALPALVEAHKVQKRAAGLGFAADEGAARASLEEALRAGGAEAIGEALFWTVALGRARGVDPETALRRATRSFVRALDGSGE